MADEDFYKTLDIPRSATQAEIQKAYRRLAKKFHPDLHDDKEVAKQRFQKIQAAYDVLGDEEKRKLYDQYGSQFEQVRGAGGAGGPFGGGSHPFSGGGQEIDFSQFFGNAGGGGARGGAAQGPGLDDFLRMFGGGRAAPGGRSGPGGAGARRAPEMASQERSLDHVMDITVPFATAVLGGEHRITIDRGGRSESITARIPPGIESGKKIRLRNLGHIDPSGRQGDLMLKVHVAPHPFYRRNGLHLMVMLPVTISEALLGTKVDLPTPHGRVTLTVPSGSSSGRVLRMKGMGIKTDKGSGDLLAELEIVVPDKLNDEQRETLRTALAAIEVTNPRLELTW